MAWLMTHQEAARQSARTGWWPGCGWGTGHQRSGGAVLVWQHRLSTLYTFCILIHLYTSRMSLNPFQLLKIAFNFSLLENFLLVSYGKTPIKKEFWNIPFKVSVAEFENFYRILALDLQNRNVWCLGDWIFSYQKRLTRRPSLVVGRRRKFSLKQ